MASECHQFRRPRERQQPRMPGSCRRQCCLRRGRTSDAAGGRELAQGIEGWLVGEASALPARSRRRASAPDRARAGPVDALNARARVSAGVWRGGAPSSHYPPLHHHQSPQPHVGAGAGAAQPQLLLTGAPQLPPPPRGLPPEPPIAMAASSRARSSPRAAPIRSHGIVGCGGCGFFAGGGSRSLTEGGRACRRTTSGSVMGGLCSSGGACSGRCRQISQSHPILAHVSGSARARVELAWVFVSQS